MAPEPHTLTRDDHRVSGTAAGAWRTALRGTADTVGRDHPSERPDQTAGAG
ncbi:MULTISPECIES: hypothetical protein [Streptomyces]|uniref:hypothetical protein n=1 Tax=Streptomyces TaxID=1883 RepID=UPI00374E0844